MTKSELFKQAHKNTKEAKKLNPEISYHGQLGLELKELYLSNNGTEIIRVNNIWYKVEGETKNDYLVKFHNQVVHIAKSSLGNEDKLKLDKDLENDDYFTLDFKQQLQKIRILNKIGQEIQWYGWSNGEIADLTHLTGYEQSGCTSLLPSRIEILDKLWSKYSV